MPGPATRRTTPHGLALAIALLATPPTPGAEAPDVNLPTGHSQTDQGEQAEDQQKEPEGTGAVPQEAPADQASEPKNHETWKDWKEKWKRFREAAQDVSHFDIKDGMFTFRVRLWLQIDGTVGFESDRLEQDIGPIDDGIDLRRGRVFAGGRLLRRFDYRVSFDFGVDSGIKNAYIDGFEKLRIARLRLGNFKEPFSLERHSSSFDIGYVEWSLPVSTFVPGRNIGAMFHNLPTDRRFTWAVGGFTNSSSDGGNPTNSLVNLTGRVTGLPLYRDAGRQLIHLGASYSLRAPKDTVRYLSRPESRFAPFFVDTGEIDADTDRLLGLELAAVNGPFWIQSEWIEARVNAAQVGDPRFGGAYVQVGFFITGESRPYRRSNGTIDRLVPKEQYRKGNPFRKGNDRGALEITARYSTLDLNDGVIRGGELDDFSIGLNWYVTPATRLMLNYIHADVAGSGNADLFLFRYQFGP